MFQREVSGGQRRENALDAISRIGVFGTLYSLLALYGVAMASVLGPTENTKPDNKPYLSLDPRPSSSTIPETVIVMFPLESEGANAKINPTNSTPRV